MAVLFWRGFAGEREEGFIRGSHVVVAELCVGCWASLAMSWWVCRGRGVGVGGFRCAPCKPGGAGTLQVGWEEKGFLRWFTKLPILFY